MIILSDTTQSLQMAVAEAITTPLEIIASYVDVTSTNVVTSGEQISTSSDTDIVSAPASSTSRHIKFLSIYNKDNVTHIVTVKKVISGTPKIIVKSDIRVGETLQYTDAEGFNIIATNGNRETYEIPTLAVSAGTNSVTSGTVIFSNSNGVNFGMSGSSQITMQVAPVTGSFWANPSGKMYSVPVNESTGGNYSRNFSLQRIFIPYHMTVTRVDQALSFTQGGSTSGTWAVSIGLYTRNVSTLNSASSSYSTLGWSSGSTTNSSQFYGANSNIRIRSFQVASWNLTPGEYWFGNLIVVTNIVGSSISINMFGQRSLNIVGPPTFINDTIGIGAVYSTTTAAFVNTMAISDLHFASNDANGAFPTRQPTFSMYGSF
jgi:hypothetical protein